MEVDPHDREKTAFVPPQGMVKYRLMSFGWTGALWTRYGIHLR